MKASRHWHFPWKVAVVVLECAAILPQVWAQDNGTKPAARPDATQASSEGLEIRSPQLNSAPEAPPNQLKTPTAPQTATVVLDDRASVKGTALDPSSPSENLASTPANRDQDYIIGPQDLLAINVWREPELSRAVPVRPDGKISLPLVGDLKASGLTPRMLQARLVEELDPYIHKPQVTVIIQEVNSYKFYIIGEVARPGSYPLAASMTVLDALASAGGFRDFAKVKRIYLLRLMADGARKRLPVDFKAAVNGSSSYRDLELQPGDTLVVP